METNNITPNEDTADQTVTKNLPKKKNVYKTIGIVVGAILLLLILSIIWFYYSPASAFKSKIMKKLSYPLTIVNGQAISYKEVSRRYDIAKKGNPSLGNLSDPEVGGKILDSIVENNELDLLSKKYGVQVTSSDLDTMYGKVVDTTTNGDQEALRGMLDRMGITTDEFKKDILRPQVIFTNLAVWYNGQKQFNEDGYKKMDSIQQAITQGQKFEDLAKIYSEDESSKNLEGDMGDVDLKTILPELSSPIATMKTGDIQRIPTRYGLHLIKVDSKNDQTGTYHIKQIFIKTGADFQNWYDQQKNSYKITTLVKHF
jgi:hypothetical protein